jgi:hypothetical protein
MSAERLRYRTEVPVHRYSLVLKSDDERVTNAVSGWVDRDIARYHEAGGAGAKIPFEIELYTSGRGEKNSSRARRTPRGTFEEGESGARFAPTGALGGITSTGTVDDIAPTGIFEDVEFYAGDKQTALLFGGKSLVVVCLEKGKARGFVAGEHLASPWILSHRIFYVPVLEILRGRGAFYIHAGCVCKGKKCILLCGGSGHGKSTLTYALARAGFSYMSDDAVFIQNNHSGVEIFAFPEKIKLDQKSRSYFPEFDRFEQSPGKMEIAAARTRIKDFSVEGQPHALIFTQIGCGGKSELTKLGRSDALLRLIAQSVSVASKSSVEKHIDILKRIAETSMSFELKLGDSFEGVPELLEKTLFP